MRTIVSGDRFFGLWPEEMARLTEHALIGVGFRGVGDRDRKYRLGYERQEIPSLESGSRRAPDAIVNGGDPSEIAVAQDLKAEGDAATAEGDAICDVALDKYQGAWEKAVFSWCN